MRNRYVRTGLEVLQERKYLRLCEVTYGVEENRSQQKIGVSSGMPNGKWELVQRTTRCAPLDKYKRSPAPFAVDSAEICAILSRGGEMFLILVAQYRPPVDAVVIEFPAGLIDSGEDAKSAALRELKEETGYFARVEDIFSVSDALCLDPGLSDSCCQFIKVRVNGDTDINRSPKPQLDEGEDIGVVLLPLEVGRNDANFTEILRTIITQMGMEHRRVIIDARLHMYLEGLSLFGLLGSLGSMR